MDRSDGHLLEGELAGRIGQRTDHRVLGLRVEGQDGQVILRGIAPSYHVKQLAQEAVLDALPGVRLQNTITVPRPEAV